MHEKEGRLEDACQLLIKALALDPLYDDARASLGRIYRLQGRMDLAEGLLRMAVTGGCWNSSDSWFVFFYLNISNNVL